MNDRLVEESVSVLANRQRQRRLCEELGRERSCDTDRRRCLHVLDGDGVGDALGAVGSVAAIAAATPLSACALANSSVRE